MNRFLNTFLIIMVLSIMYAIKPANTPVQNSPETETKWVAYQRALPAIIKAIDSMDSAERTKFNALDYKGQAEFIFKKAGYSHKPKWIVANGKQYEIGKFIEILYRTFDSFSIPYKATFLAKKTDDRIESILYYAKLNPEKIGFSS